MKVTPTPTSGAADLRTAAQAVVERWDTPLWKDVPATAEYIGRLRAALAAGQATAAQQGVAYAALPEPYCNAHDDADARYPDMFSEHQMRAFADATCALRVESLAAAYCEELDKLSQRNYELRLASHGQAPAQPATVHCKGRNCAAVDGDGHSDECASDHERAASGLDTAGNRNPVARYDGYRGAPCNPSYTKDQRAAWLEGYEARNRQGITPSPQAAQKASAGVTLRSMIEGMSVSVDVSTGDHDAGHRYFGTVTEVMECQGNKHGVTLLVQDAEPNFTATPTAPSTPSSTAQQAASRVRMTLTSTSKESSMGEYARQYTLDRFGVDIGDDREPIKTKPVKRYGCSCGRVFITQQAKEQHQKDTGHINKGGQHG